MDLNWLLKIVSLKQRIFVMGSECVNDSHNILDMKNGDFFKLNILLGDQQVWSRCCRDDLVCLWASLPCCLSKGTVKRHFLVTYLIACLRVPKFGNTLCVRVKLFWKCSNLLHISKVYKKIQKTFFVYDISASELVA